MLMWLGQWNFKNDRQNVETPDAVFCQTSHANLVHGCAEFGRQIVCHLKHNNGNLVNGLTQKRTQLLSAMTGVKRWTDRRGITVHSGKDMESHSKIIYLLLFNISQRK